MTKKKLKITPHLEAVYVTAITSDGFYSTCSTPQPDTVKRLSITSIVRDPDQQLFQACLAAGATHTEDTTLTGARRIACIGMPGMELSFEVGDAPENIATTAIELDVWDLDILLADMIQATLMDSEGYRRTFTLDMSYWILRNKVQTHVGPTIGTDFDDILPMGIGDKLHRHEETYCVGTALRGLSAADFDYWKLTAWSAGSFLANAPKDPRAPWSIPVNAYTL